MNPTLPWTAADWLPRTLDRVDECLHRLGRARTGPAVHVKNWSVSAVLRIPATGGVVWYKAAPPVFAHEGRVMDWVVEVMPGLVPSVLAFGRGWLLTEEMPAAEPNQHGHPIESIIRLQQATIGRGEELLALGCPDRRPHRALAETAELSQRRDLLGVARADVLAAVLPELADAVAQAESPGLPPVLVHGDLNGENSRWTSLGWVTVDWTDASLAHPATELAQPLIDADAAEVELLEGLFARCWATAAEPSAVRQALRSAPLLGSMHQAGTYRRIVDQVGMADDHLEMLHFWVDRLTAMAVRR